MKGKIGGFPLVLTIFLAIILVPTLYSEKTTRDAVRDTQKSVDVLGTEIKAARVTPMLSATPTATPTGLLKRVTPTPTPVTKKSATSSAVSK